MPRTTRPTRYLAGVAVALAGAIMLGIPGRPGALIPGPASQAPERADAWVADLHQAEHARAQRDLGAARQAWQRAFRAALASRRWEGMLEVGNASLRIGDSPGAREPSLATARRLYLEAFFRAKAEGSLEGVLRAAEAFAALGDHEVVAQCLRVAERMAAGVNDANNASRLLALRERQAAEATDATRVSQDLRQ